MPRRGNGRRSCSTRLRCSAPRDPLKTPGGILWAAMILTSLVLTLLLRVYFPASLLLPTHRFHRASFTCTISWMRAARRASSHLARSWHVYRQPPTPCRRLVGYTFTHEHRQGSYRWGTPRGQDDLRPCAPMAVGLSIPGPRLDQRHCAGWRNLGSRGDRARAVSSVVLGGRSKMISSVFIKSVLLARGGIWEAFERLDCGSRGCFPFF